MKGKTQFGTLFFIILLMLLLFACRSTAPEPTSVPPTDTPSPSASPTPTQSKTPRPTRTLKPTSTPKPTENRPQPVDLLDDFFAEPSPTFDTALAVTKTPSAPQHCPADNPDLVFDPEKIHEPFEMVESDEPVLNIFEKRDYILDYLNSGGAIEPVLQICKQSPPYGSTYCGDLTGDGQPEIMFRMDGLVTQGEFYIFSCLDGEYKEIYSTDQLDVFKTILLVEDMNLDGIPELVLEMYPGRGFSYWANYEILSWNGRTMVSQIAQSGFGQTHLNALVDPDGIGISGLGEGYDASVDQWQISDIDHNGTLEFIIRGGLETHYYFGLYEPSLPYELTLMWNGDGFVVQDVEIGDPQYRFQAVQNGDAYTLLHQYDQARKMYLAAINDPSLEWWTAEKSEQIVLINEYHSEDFITPTPSVEDFNEHPNLAAYAQYRLILLDVLEGDLENAEQEFAAMQESYPAGQAGSVYVDFTDAFLEGYQTSGDVPQACQAALDYGKSHSDELLRYFSEEQGFKIRLVYELTDLCPFE